MTDRVADADERLRALAAGESFIVRAPAGSGKTELLIRRYLALLALAEEPEEVVAITFTRKAAAEMQSRILDALDRAEQGVAPQSDSGRALAELAAAVVRHSASRGWDLRDNPARLRVQTVDSLNAALTRMMPLLAGFGVPPRTLEDARDLHREAAGAALLDSTLEPQWLSSVDTLLEHLDNDLPRVRDLLAGMLARREQWLEQVTRLHRQDLDAALVRLVESCLAAARDAVPSSLHAELAMLANHAGTTLAADGSDSPITACRGLVDLPAAAAGDLDRWRGLANLLLTRQDGWRRQADTRLGFPPEKKSAGSAAGDGMKLRFKALLGELQEVEILRLRLAEVRRLPDPVYGDRDWRVAEALCRVLLLADAQLRVLSAQRNQTDFNGVALGALRALGPETDPTDLALHLDFRIRHLLVDEFQDISAAQYTLLCRLTAGWTGGDGRTLFLVGDPMQSIYRFRQAEVGVFLDAWRQQRLGQVPLTPLGLRVNFRSRIEIVQWVNEAFDRILPSVPDPDAGAVAFSAAVARHAAPGRGSVQFHALRDFTPEREAALVVTLIHEARAAPQPHTVGILVRSRSHLPGIIRELRTAGVRCQAVEIEALGERPAIQDLLALTRALHRSMDRVAWFALLRAPWCGLTLAELLLIAGDDPNAVIRERIQRVEIRALLDAGSQARLERLCAGLVPALEQRGRSGTRRWVESAWIAIGGPATLRDSADLENAEAFFELLDEFDQGGEVRDFARFEQQAAELFAAPDAAADPNLQIMTIHKAKGLEFDTVIVPGLQRCPRRQDAPVLRWLQRAVADGARDLLMAPMAPSGTGDSPVYDCIEYFEGRQQHFEDGRLLYVAATRARSSLHLIGNCNSREKDGVVEVAPPRSGSFLRLLWPLVEDRFADTVPDAAPPAADEPVSQRTLSRLPAGWQRPEPATPALAGQEWASVPSNRTAVEFDWAGDSIRHVGTVAHRFLQRMAEDGPDAWRAAGVQQSLPAIRQGLLQLGVDQGELDKAQDTVRQVLENVLQDERARWLFSTAHSSARNEYGLSGIIGGRLVTVRIDRTFVDADGVRWIIDYKTSRHGGGDLDSFLDSEQQRYRAQLETYATLFSTLEDRPIRAALYFPLLKGWRDWAAVGTGGR